MLYFDVINQTLKRVDRFSPATDSVDYLTAIFNFKTDDWNGKAKRALFRLGTKTYTKTLDSKNSCIVPYEVLKASDESKASFGAKNKVFVSVVGEVGTVRLPTNELRVDLETSGYAEAENGADPTPSMYAQFVADVKAATEEHAANAETYMNTASEKAAEASESAATLKNDYSNALKGKASGAVVRVDDVSPVEHMVDVRAAPHNRLKFETEQSFTATSSYKWIKASDWVLNAGTYIFTCSADFGIACRLWIYDENGVLCRNLGNEELFTLSDAEAFNVSDIRIVVEGLTSEETYTGNIYPQIEKGTTATEYTPYVDPSTVTVTRCGKNLWNYKPSTVKNGVTVTTDENGCITFNGACTNDFVIYGTIALNKGVYTLSDNASGNKPSTVDARTQVYIPSLGVDARLKHGDNPDACVKFELSKNATDVHIRIKGAGGFTYNNYAIYPLLEVGEEATEFEAYNGTEYTPNADGTINGLTSVSPTMTLLTDTEGVTVECEYNQDINTVFERFKNAIIALGGVI